METFSLRGAAGEFLLDLPGVDKADLCLLVTSCESIIYHVNRVEIVVAPEALCLGTS